MPTFADNESGSSVRTKINSAITTVDGLGSGDNLLLTAAERSKLSGVEANATADQTGAEIKSAYEGEADTNAFTDADHTKLDGIATGAEVNPSVVSQAEAEAGTATTERIWTAQRVAQAIAALETGGSGGVSASTGSGAPSSTPSSEGDIYIDTTGDIAYIATGTASSADWDKVITDAGISSLTDTAMTTSDLFIFGDNSDSDNPKTRSVTNALSDLNIAVLGANVFTGTQDFNGQQTEAHLGKVVASVTGTLTTLPK